MSTEHTNPEGEVADDDLVNLIAGRLTADEETEQEEETEEPQVEEVEEDAEVEEPKVRRLRVKLDGQETELPEDEVVAGYQRQADYTRKTQEVAEQRKAVEQERQAAAQERAVYAQRLQQLAQELAPPAVNWEALKDDPFAFNDALTKEWARQQKATQVRAELERVHQQQMHEEHQARARQLAEGAERLAKLIPEYADDAKRPAVQAAIRNYAQSIGFSAEELAEASDHRAVVVLNKARLYDDLLARAAKVKPAVVSAAKPGVSRVPVDVRKKAMDRLKQSGSDADALAALKTLL
jgi:hypothetical protein